jgi:hypothetical protein
MSVFLLSQDQVSYHNSALLESKVTSLSLSLLSLLHMLTCPSAFHHELKTRGPHQKLSRWQHHALVFPASSIVSQDKPILLYKLCSPQRFVITTENGTRLWEGRRGKKNVRGTNIEAHSPVHKDNITQCTLNNALNNEGTR